MTDFDPVIGLEVHVQLATKTKLFCGCPNSYGAEPNTNVCQVCTAQPGVLPVLNAQALALAVRAGLALGCTIPPRTKFDRKNYFYPDLPKGYQISQFDRPLNQGGGVTIEGDDGKPRVIGLVRAHLEEDAGKNIHPDGVPFSLVDLNRSGIPLLEIVSAPDLRSPAEAHRYLDELKRILRYSRVSECDMEKGSLRCDANVSVRPRGQAKFNTKVEIKNLNSFRNVERALAYEIERQTAVYREGGTIRQETRGWRDADAKTEAMRSKEEAHDYRYFPDPDLPEFSIEPAWVESIRAELPEAPSARLARYVTKLGISEQSANVLVAERDTSDYFERCLALGARDAKDVANFVLSAVLAEANARGVGADQSAIAPQTLLAVVAMVADGRVSRQAAHKLLAEHAASGKAPDVLVKELGLEQVSDRGELDRIVADVIAGAPKAVAEYRAGKQNALNSLVGGVMKASKGKANPNLARELLLAKLDSLKES